MRIIINKEINTMKMNIKTKLHLCAIQLKHWLRSQQEEFGVHIGNVLASEEIDSAGKAAWVKELMAENMIYQ